MRSNQFESPIFRYETGILEFLVNAETFPLFHELTNRLRGGHRT